MTPQEIKDTLDRYEAEVEPQPKKKRGAPVQPRTLARQRLAAELGVTADTLRKTEWVLAHPNREVNPVVKGPPIASLGLNLARDFVLQVQKAQEYLDSADKHLRAAQGALTRMAKDTGVVFPAGRLQRLTEDTRELAGRVRGARPISLCPWCKGQDGIQPECSACEGTGFITANKAGSIPAELLDEQTIRVAKDGKIVEWGIEEGVIEHIGGPMLRIEPDPWGLGE